MARPVLATASVALVLVVAEFWVLPRVMGLARASALLGFTAEPGHVDDVAISRLGFAGDDLQLEKPEGAVRVLTLGGSVLFNRRMSQRLKAGLTPLTERSLELMGAALRAHTSWASVHKWRRLSPYGFDLVFVYHGINELFAEQVAPEDFRHDYAQLGAWHVRNRLLEHSMVSRLIFNAFLYQKPARAELGSRGRAAEVFEGNLGTLVDEIRASGARPVLSTFAWSIPSDYRHDRFQEGRLGYDNPERYDPVPVEIWGPVPYVRAGLIRHNVIVHRVASERQVDLFDAEQLMGHDPKHFGDVCHFSEAGSDRFVTLLSERVAREGWLE